MSVYEIGEYIIVAKNTSAAFGVYVEETNNLENYVFDELAEGEETEVTITIKRITNAGINAKQVPCCSIWGDGCELCEGKNEEVYVSYQDLIDKRKESDFPCVIAKEE